MLGKLEWANGDRYEGQFFDGLRSGQGEYNFFKDKRNYVGGWKESMRSGKGVETWPNGDKYDGEWLVDKFHGQGNLRTTGGVYVGEFENGVRSGVGKQTLRMKKAVYEGEYKNGRMHGKGVYQWEDGSEYEGQYKDGLRHGQGIQSNLEGERYDGAWEFGKKHGLGNWQAPTGMCRWGVWVEDERKKWVSEESFGKKQFHGKV